MNPARISRSIFIVIAAALLSPAMKPLAAQAPAATPSTQAAAPAPPQPPAKLTPKEAREAQITADSLKLYQLAQELKVEVDKSSKDTMSLSVIKKAEEIEKLAKELTQNIRAN